MNCVWPLTSLLYSLLSTLSFCFSCTSSIAIENWIHLTLVCLTVGVNNLICDKKAVSLKRWELNLLFCWSNMNTLRQIKQHASSLAAKRNWITNLKQRQARIKTDSLTGKGNRAVCQDAFILSLPDLVLSQNESVFYSLECCTIFNSERAFLKKIHQPAATSAFIFARLIEKLNFYNATLTNDKDVSNAIVDTYVWKKYSHIFGQPQPYHFEGFWLETGKDEEE